MKDRIVNMLTSVWAALNSFVGCVLPIPEIWMNKKTRR